MGWVVGRLLSLADEWVGSSASWTPASLSCDQGGARSTSMSPVSRTVPPLALTGPRQMSLARKRSVTRRAGFGVARGALLGVPGTAGPGIARSALRGLARGALLGAPGTDGLGTARRALLGIL